MQSTQTNLSKSVSTTSHRLISSTWFWLAFALWILYFAAAWFTAQFGEFGLVDYRVYYTAAHQFAAGANPYLGAAPYIYPPLLADLLMPLALTTSLQVSWAIWFVGNCAIMLGVIALGWYTDPRRRRVIWFAPLLFMGIHEALVTGQVTIILMGIFALAWWTYRTDHPRWTGALLALAACIKLYPALFIIYFLWKRDWRVMTSALLWVGLFILIQIILTPPAVLNSMVQSVFSLSDSGQMWLLNNNMSVLGYTTQLFDGGGRVLPIVYNPTLVTVSRILICAALIIVGAWLTLPIKRTAANRVPFAASAQFDLEFSLVLLTALLLSPTLWMSGAPPLLICIYLIWRHGGRRTGWFCLLALLTLTLYYVYVIGYDPALMTSGLIVSFGFYILIAIWAVNVWLLLPLRRVATQKASP